MSLDILEFRIKNKNKNGKTIIKCGLRISFSITSLLAKHRETPHGQDIG